LLCCIHIGTTTLSDESKPGLDFAVKPSVATLGIDPGGCGLDFLVGSRGRPPELKVTVHFYAKKGLEVKDLNETIQSKIFMFVLLNWPIVLSEIDVMMVRFRLTILTDVYDDGDDDDNEFTQRGISPRTTRTRNSNVRSRSCQHSESLMRQNSCTCVYVYVCRSNVDCNIQHFVRFLV